VARHAALVPLSHDHHHGLVLARRMARARSAPERSAAAEAFAAFIAGEGGEHFREEEELLFPLVALAAGDPCALVDRALLEHGRLRAAAARFRRAGDALDPADLEATAALFEAHIRCEERELFPLAERIAARELESLVLPARVPAGGRAEAAALAAGETWSVAGADLNATLVEWSPGEGVVAHRNDERDVLLVVVAGSGTVTTDGRATEVSAPAAVVIPKGTERSIAAGPDGLRYVSAHRRREAGIPIRPRVSRG
jgi:quercetin dioxygenase-like cupin family protein